MLDVVNQPAYVLQTLFILMNHKASIYNIKKIIMLDVVNQPPYVLQTLCILMNHKASIHVVS